MKTISAWEAKNAFGPMIGIGCAEPVLIEKHGGGVAMVLSVEEYKRLQRNGTPTNPAPKGAKVGGDHVRQQQSRRPTICGGEAGITQHEAERKMGGCAPESESLQTSSTLRLQCKTDPHLSGFVAICQGDKA